MRRVSFAARQALGAQNTDEIEVLLVIIEHPDIPGGIIRLSSDQTTRIPGINPPVYGTYSTWRTTDGSPCLATMIDGLLPDEKDDAPSQASLALALLDSDVGDTFTSTTEQAVCHMAVVMASSPNVIEGEWLKMKMTDSDIDSGQVAMRFSTESLYDEPASADRMVKGKFPGLHR